MPFIVPQHFFADHGGTSCGVSNIIQNLSTHTRETVPRDHMHLKLATSPDISDAATAHRVCKNTIKRSARLVPLSSGSSMFKF